MKKRIMRFSVRAGVTDKQFGFPLMRVDCAVERAEKKEAVLASIVLEKCQWKRSRLAKYQVLPPKGAPVRDTKPQRNAWHAVAEELRTVLEILRDSKPRTKGIERIFRLNL